MTESPRSSSVFSKLKIFLSRAARFLWNMYATPVPTFANKPGTVPRKKDGVTTGPRVKQALPPISQLHELGKKSQALSRSAINALSATSQEVFSESSQHSQVYTAEMRGIEERLANRAQVDDDSTQLAIRAADNDTRKALEAAGFFRDEAANARQQSEMLVQRVAALEKDNEALVRRLDKSSSMLNSVALELFSDISTQTIDKDMLLTQYSRIKSLVADCNHISSEIGFPSTSVPEIVELLDPQALQGMTGNMLIIEGVPRSIQSIALSLTLAECQILRSLNFLLKHFISETQKATAQDSSNAQMSADPSGNKVIESSSRASTGAGHQTDPALDDIIRQATLSSPIMSAEQLQHPNDVFRIEFQGSGVAVAKALVELRRKTASFLLREARFDHDPLLKRTATDSTTLRTLVAALQNELYFTRQALEMVKGLGLSSEIFPITNQANSEDTTLMDTGLDTQSGLDTTERSEASVSTPAHGVHFPLPNFSSADIIKLAENALTSAVDLELLPSELTKKLEDIVENALAASDDVDKAKETQQYSSEERVSVTEIQRLIMLREKALQHIDAAAQEFLDQLANSDVMRAMATVEDSTSEVQGTFGVTTYDEPSALLSFAKDANESQAKLLARFSKEQDNFINDIRQININIGEGHTEKYSKDGSGFLDVLYRHAALLEHTLELHKIVVARNIALAKLQAIISCLQKSNEKNVREAAYLAAVRNGILKGYVEQSRKIAVLRQENNHFRLQIAQSSLQGINSQGKERQDALSAAIIDAAITGDPQYCSSLAGCVESLTQGYRMKIAECKAEMCAFGNTLTATSDKIMQMLEGYRVMIETRACKLVQTDRKRRTFDTAVATEDPEAAPAVAQKKK